MFRTLFHYNALDQTGKVLVQDVCLQKQQIYFTIYKLTWSYS